MTENAMLLGELKQAIKDLKETIKEFKAEFSNLKKEVRSQDKFQWKMMGATGGIAFIISIGVEAVVFYIRG